MKKHQRVIGQILSAVGVTLMAGGIASFFFPNVELRFFGQLIFTEHGRILWIAGYSIIALFGLILWRSSVKKYTR